jgi:hypothetical protein
MALTGSAGLPQNKMRCPGRKPGKAAEIYRCLPVCVRRQIPQINREANPWLKSCTALSTGGVMVLLLKGALDGPHVAHRTGSTRR